MPSAHIAGMNHSDSPAPAPTDDLATYLRSIAAFELLSPEQEVDLAAAIEAGLYADHLLTAETTGVEDRADLKLISRLGKEAMDTFYKSNLRLVIFIAKRHRNRGVPFPDLIQDGNLGLWHAVQKFDHTKDIKFSTYAVWWIRASITQGIADQRRTIRLPVKQDAMVTKVMMAASRHSAAHDRQATPEELADATDLPLHMVNQALVWGLHPDSLDEAFDDTADGYASLWDPLEPTPFDHAAKREMAEKVALVLDTLPARSAEILTMRFGLADGEPLTLREVGAVVGLSPEHVRKLEVKAINELRGPAGRNALLDFYEPPAGHVFPLRRVNSPTLMAA